MYLKGYPMRYRRLGNTGLMVSEVSFGTIPILKGSVPVLPDYYNLEDDKAIEVMNYAYKKGVNLYDTAIVPEYGDAEIKLGKFSEFIGRENIIISDKARFFSGDEMYGAVLESTRNLKTYPDIYFVHQVDEKNEGETFGDNGAVEALYQLKKEGKIKFTGIASHYYNVLLKGANDKRIDILQGSGNILERGMLERIKNEKAFRNKGFLLNKVYAAGILPKFFSTKELIEGVLSYPVSTALIGLGTFSEVDEAINSNFKYDLPSFEKVLSELEKSFNPIHCDRCQRCKCPHNIEIHIIFRQYNYYFLGKNYWALKKLDLSIEESFFNCKKCLSLSCLKTCPKNINVPYVIGKIRDLVKIHIRNLTI